MPKFYDVPFYNEEQIIQIEEKDLQFPFSSKHLKYDSVKRQYIPTEELLIEHGIDLGGFLSSIGENTPDRRNEELEYISDQIYTYIDKNSGSNVETLKFIIAKGIRRGMSPFRFRLRFEEIMWKQARFYINNDDLTKSSGVDMEKKQWVTKDILNNEDRNIDPRVKVMLMDLGLTWVGSYDEQFGRYILNKNW